MYRVTKSGNIWYAVLINFEFEATLTDISSLVYSGETVLLMEDLENLCEEFDVKPENIKRLGEL